MLMGNEKKILNTFHLLFVPHLKTLEPHVIFVQSFIQTLSLLPGKHFYKNHRISCTFMSLLTTSAKISLAPHLFLAPFRNFLIALEYLKVEISVWRVKVVSAATIW